MFVHVSDFVVVRFVFVVPVSSVPFVSHARMMMKILMLQRRNGDGAMELTIVLLWRYWILLVIDCQDVVVAEVSLVGGWVVHHMIRLIPCRMMCVVRAYGGGVVCHYASPIELICLMMLGMMGVMC